MTRSLLPPFPWGTSEENSAAILAALATNTAAVAALGAKLDLLHTDNTDPITEMPPPPLNNAKTRPISKLDNVNSSAAQVLVAGVGGQTVRMGRTIFSLSAACVFEIMDGATSRRSLETFGPFSAIIDVTDGEPLVVTTAGNALQVKTTPAVRMYISSECEQS